MYGQGWRRSQASSRKRIRLMEVWTEPMNWTHSSIGSVWMQAQHPFLPPAKQTSHNPLTHSFPVTSQLSHLPSELWILLLLHRCLQPHQEMLGPPPSPSPLSVSSSQLKKRLDRLNWNKAAGPDVVSPRVLKACVDQLCGILQHLFNLSLSQEEVLVLRKTSCLDISSISSQWLKTCSPNIMKVVERILLVHWKRQTRTRTHCNLLIVGEGPLELKTLSYTCFNEPTVIWTKQAALCSLISTVHLTQSSLLYYARNSRGDRWMSPKLSGFLTVWQTDHSLWDWMVLCLTR